MSKSRAIARAKQADSVTQITPNEVPVTSADVKRAQNWIADEADLLAAQDSFEDLAYAAAHQAMLAKARQRLLEERAVRLGRQGDVSWDVLGGWLTVPGETLRRRYGS